LLTTVCPSGRDSLFSGEKGGKEHQGFALDPYIRHILPAGLADSFSLACGLQNSVGIGVPTSWARDSAGSGYTHPRASRWRALAKPADA